MCKIGWTEAALGREDVAGASRLTPRWPPSSTAPIPAARRACRRHGLDPDGAALTAGGPSSSQLNSLGAMTVTTRQINTPTKASADARNLNDGQQAPRRHPERRSTNNRRDRSNTPTSVCPDPACCAYPDTGLLLICHILVIDTQNVARRSPSSDQDTRKTAGHTSLRAHFRRAAPI